MTKRSLVDDMTKRVSGLQVPAALMHDPDLAGSYVAMHRAAARARRIAAETGTPMAIFRDGKIVWVKVDADP